MNARNIVGIVVFLIVVYLVLHFLFHVPRRLVKPTPTSRRTYAGQAA